MGHIKETAKNLNRKARREKTEREQGYELAQEAVGILKGIFDRFPESLDENGRPVRSFRAPRFTTPEGVEMQLDRTNYYGGNGMFNVSIVDDTDVFHGYAQLSEGSKRIDYWDPNRTNVRITGTIEQDRELVSVLKVADKSITN